MLEIKKAGIYNSIQDLGRVGFRKYGVPQSGCLDMYSAKWANKLLNNSENDAVIELFLSGIEIIFKKETQICFGGAQLNVTINKSNVKLYKVYNVSKGDILKVTSFKKGNIAYLAVKGGFQTDKVLDSRSFSKGITVNEKLHSNDIISYKSFIGEDLSLNASLKVKDLTLDSDEIMVFEGPDFDLFDKQNQQYLLNSFYSLTSTISRMGYRLTNSNMQHSISMITSPVLPGTVQLMPSGELIVLMKEAQTTGGYPRIFQLTQESLAILSQMKIGKKFKFSLLK